jgi:hypothetical protein
MTTHVTETAAAPSDLAVRHFEEMLAFETDCWDLHESLKSADRDFIVVDVRAPNAFAKGHVEGAINIPHREMTAGRMAEYPKCKNVCGLLCGPALQRRKQGGAAPCRAWTARKDDDRRRDWLDR